MNAPDITNTSGRCIMDFPEAFKFIEQTAPDKETHHPKCSYRQAGMLCDCSVLWAEYHKRRATQAEERERVLREALKSRFGKCGRKGCRAVNGMVNRNFCIECQRILAAIATPAPAQSLLERIDQVAVEMKATPDWKKGSPINERTPAQPSGPCFHCGHDNPHTSPAGCIDDACNEPDCNCGYYVPAQPSAEKEGQ